MAWFDKKQPTEAIREASESPAKSSDPARDNLYSGPDTHSPLADVLAKLDSNPVSVSAIPTVTPTPVPTEPTEAPEPEPLESEAPATTNRGRTGQLRNRQIRVRMSENECARFYQRVQKSGLTQSDFIRKAILGERIAPPEDNSLLTNIDDTLHALSAEMGRQGGMLKMVVKPNKGQRELNPEEWEELCGAIRKLEYAQKEINHIREILYDHKAQSQ